MIMTQYKVSDICMQHVQQHDKEKLDQRRATNTHMDHINMLNLSRHSVISFKRSGEHYLYNA